MTPYGPKPSATSPSFLSGNTDFVISLPSPITRAKTEKVPNNIEIFC